MALSSKRQVVDSDYLLRRAETEVELAEKATSGKAAATHHKLASAYIDRLFANQASAEPQRNELDVKRENRAAVSALFKCWKVEQQDPGMESLLTSLQGLDRRQEHILADC
jgi:hypothetical protein